MKIRVLLPALVAAVALAASAPAVSSEPVGEYEAKAAFLYNFAKFVRWPEEAFSGPESAFRVCVIGEDPFGTSLEETFSGKQVRDRPAVTMKVETAEDARGCHILFVSDSEERRVRWILGALESESVLTVADVEEFAERGGVVRFVLDDRRIRFEVNVGAAERAGLHVSSQLLRLARRVWSEPGEEQP